MSKIASFFNVFSGLFAPCCKTEPDLDIYAYLVTRRSLLLSLIACVMMAISLAPSPAPSSGTPTGWSESSYFSVRQTAPPPDGLGAITDTCAIFSDLYEVKVQCTRYSQAPAEIGGAVPPPVVGITPGACLGCASDPSRQGGIINPQAFSWVQLYAMRGCAATDAIGGLNKTCNALTTLLTVAGCIHALVTFALLVMMGHIAAHGESLIRMWNLRGGIEFAIGKGVTTQLSPGSLTKARAAYSNMWLYAPALFSLIVVLAWPAALTTALLYLCVSQHRGCPYYAPFPIKLTRTHLCPPPNAHTFFLFPQKGGKC
jgi:hypothetical protein